MTTQNLDRIRERICDPVFLENKGLSNEVGIHVFCYAPQDEMMVREHIRRLREDSSLPCHIEERDLYEIFLAILEEKRVLKAAPELEEKKGSAYLLAQLRRTASPQAFLERMDYRPHTPGRDVLFVTGVGKVHPFLLSHDMLNNMQHRFADIPVVMFYPGSYNGQTLSLFDESLEGNYYRAFNLL